MVRAEVLQGVRQMRFEGLLERHERSEMSQQEVAEMLGVSERTLRRWRDRLRDEGPEGLRDRRIGKASSRRAAAEEILRMLGLYLERYEGFTASSTTRPMSPSSSANAFAVRRARALTSSTSPPRARRRWSCLGAGSSPASS
jgi:predicted DNA-binding transcriptional regulator YafY